VSAAPDSLTVLRSRSLRLAKRLRADGGADGYDRAKHLDAFTMPVTDLAGVLRLLHHLLPRPDCCVIRGGLVHGDRAKGIRRLLYSCTKTGELPTFRDVPRSWLALDLDGVPMPADVLATDLAGCGAAALAVLPSAFHGAACIAQASASHGRAPGLRLRLWVWLDRPTWGHELKRWLRDTPADPSVFGAVQPIYTAAPVLAAGVSDPMPSRLLMLRGQAMVHVPPPEALAPPTPPVRPATTVQPSHANRYVRAALVRAAHRISTSMHPGRHPTIVGETTRLARFVEPGWLTSSSIAAVVRAAAQEAGKDDTAEIDACIAWGLEHPWTAGPMPRRERNG